MFKSNNASGKILHTRKINPKLGLLGFFGFFGLLGFLPYLIKTPENIIPFPFFFFSFFGFFGFYYEGKMSNTLIDERFEANAYRASAIANKTALLFIFITSIITLTTMESTYNLLSILIATIGCAFGLANFLGHYLLYRFENEA